MAPATAGGRAKVDLAGAGLVGELTNMELATLALLVEGYSNKEISERLCVSTNTVKTHLKSAYGKLGVSRRTQAVRRLQQLGIFEELGTDYLAGDEPQLDQPLPVLAGDSGQALAFGPGLLQGSCEPGQPRTTVIAAHRDAHFDGLGKLKAGASLRSVFPLSPTGE